MSNVHACYIPDSTPTLGQCWTNVGRNIGQTLASQCWASRVLSSRPILAQYWLTIIWQHGTNKGPTSDIIGGPMSVQQWCYVTRQHLANISRNIGPTMASHFLGRQSFGQWANIGTILANHHHTNNEPIKVQHQISLMGQCRPNSGYMHHVSI